MKIQPVKGTRDFYPPDMSVRNWIIDGWKRVSLRNGFEEYDGPIFEYLKMFQLKSGDEIVEQLFSLKDRGGRELALRPEITPTLARMVNQQINSLPKPIKWFSVPRLFRAERPQKGRLREFFQWNIDIIGEDSVLADAETIFCAIDYLREVGLTPDDIVVKISSRKLLAAVLKEIGVPQKNLESLYAVLDKKNKLPAETFKKLLSEQVSDKKMAAKIQDFMELENISQIEQMFGRQEAFDEFVELQKLLGRMVVGDYNVGDYCRFDQSIVRGLAYYTGIVYEIYDKESELRAIGGGGRYDDLLKQFGGPDIPATGFGIGDCVLGILLEEKRLLKSETKKLDYFVAYVKEEYKIRAVQIAFKLRSTKKVQSTERFRVEFSYKGGKLGKQLKLASDKNAEQCIIIGDELFRNNELVIKDMAAGEQKTIDIDKFFAELKS